MRTCPLVRQGNEGQSDRLPDSAPSAQASSDHLVDRPCDDQYLYDLSRRSMGPKRSGVVDLGVDCPIWVSEPSGGQVRGRSPAPCPGAIINTMSSWPIERSWLVVTAKGERLRVPSKELRTWRACVMLGAAGLGKTFELAYIAELDRADGFEVRNDRLAVLGQTPEGLTSALDAMAAAATPNTALLLDAFDEVMVPVRTAGLIVQRWVTERLAPLRPHLRLSCRSAVWPNDVLRAIQTAYEEDDCIVAVLQPLSDEDVLAVAVARGIDAAGFLRAVDTAGVRALSEQPLTLEMLLRIYETHEALPGRRRELFEQGTAHLARERRERERDGTAVNVQAQTILEGAERLACYGLLAGRETIDLSDYPLTNALSAHDVEGLPGGDRPLNASLLDAICRSGLCEGAGPDRFRFAHRQFAEYLAGRRIAKLLPHQAKALLSAGAALPSTVAGPLRETAAFAAMESAGVAAWVSSQDPEVIGLSDVADGFLRRQAVLNLLEKFRRSELTDAYALKDSVELAGFQYVRAEDDLRPVLGERAEGCQDAVEFAVDLIESWELSSMSDDLASLMLDPTAPLQNRVSAGYALVKIGTPDARRRLLPLVTGGPDDPES